MKWLRIPIIVTVVLLLLMPLPVLADTSEDVTVTATGYICEAPGGFTLTYISDYEVGISWSKGTDAENTMIRAAIGRLPENRTDGYLVYYGDGTSTSDTGVSLDETAAAVHYRAWSQNAGGVWEESGISDFIEGVGMLLIALVLLGVILLGLAFAFRQMVLAFSAGFVFIGLSVVGWTNRVETFDIYGIIAIVGLILILVSFVCGFLVQHQRAEESFRSQRRYEKEFPLPEELTEEEAYSQLLDREIGDSAEAKAIGKAKTLRRRYREMMNR